MTIREILTESVITAKTIHDLADRKGIAWDNEPSFLRLTKQLTGKQHLDDLNQTELRRVKQYLEQQSVSEGIPQPGPSSGAPKQFGTDAKIQTRQMTVKDIISSVPGVPYYNNVVDDWDAKDYSWGVTKKVIEYATYLQEHPETLSKLPPVIVLNGKFEDGAHRVSAIWLLQQRMDPKNLLWKNHKLKIQFVTQGVAEAVIPSEQIKSSILYHGTPTKAGYDGIAREGLKVNPELIAQKYKGQEDFAPLPGVYMTKEFGNAVRYSFMSEVSDEQYADYIKQEPYGYVFEFSGKNLSTVTPDEDELGSFLEKLVKTKNLPPKLLGIVQSIPQQLRIKLQQSEIDFQTTAVAGKWVVNNISDATMQHLLKKYHNVVNYDSMKPIAVWVIPKPNQRFLRDRQGTFNTYNGYLNYAKRFGKRYDLSTKQQGVVEGKPSGGLAKWFREKWVNIANAEEKS